MRDEANDDAPQVEKFTPATSRIGGVLGLLLVVAIAVVSVVDAGGDVPPWLLAGCALVGVAIWAFMIRPDARAEGGELVLRGPVDTRWVPLGAIEDVAVGAMLAVTAEGRTYTNASVGRSFRQSRRDPGADLAARSHGAHVEARIDALATGARVNAPTAGAVRREWALPEIVALVVTGLALVVTAFL